MEEENCCGQAVVLGSVSARASCFIFLQVLRGAMKGVKLRADERSEKVRRLSACNSTALHGN